MEVKELTKRLKKRDGMRKYLNYHKRNIYYIDQGGLGELSFPSFHFFGEL